MERPFSSAVAIRWVCVILYTALISVLSLAPCQTFDDCVLPVPHLDKVAHFVMYGGLAGLLNWAIRLADRAWRVRWLMGISAFCVLYELTMEALQLGLSVCGREFSVADAMANTLGVCVTLTGIYVESIRRFQG